MLQRIIYNIITKHQPEKHVKHLKVWVLNENESLKTAFQHDIQMQYIAQYRLFQ